MRGVPIDKDMEYVGNFFTLLNPMSLLGGLVILGLSLTHGAFFLALKTDGDIQRDARALGTTLGLGAAVLAVVLLLARPDPGHAVVVDHHRHRRASRCVGGDPARTSAGREGWAFIGTVVTFALGRGRRYFLTLYPNVMPTTLARRHLAHHRERLEQPSYTLKIMTVAALVFTPIVLLYTGYTYWVFRKRLSTQHIPARSPSP